MFTRALKNRYIGYANVTTKELLNHLFTTYGKISGNDLRVNDTRMNAPYDVNLPIEVLFDQVEDGMDFTEAGNHPKTPEQIFMIGQQLIQETGMFTDNLEIWKQLPAQDRTWTRLETDFSLFRQELRENAAFGQVDFAQSNNVSHDEEIASAMANFATTAAADRTTMETLTTTLQSLTAELVAVSSSSQYSPPTPPSPLPSQPPENLSQKVEVEAESAVKGMQMTPCSLPA